MGDLLVSVAVVIVIIVGVSAYLYHRAKRIRDGWQEFAHQTGLKLEIKGEEHSPPRASDLKSKIAALLEFVGAKLILTGRYKGRGIRIGWKEVSSARSSSRHMVIALSVSVPPTHRLLMDLSMLMPIPVEMEPARMEVYKQKTIRVRSEPPELAAELLNADRYLHEELIRLNTGQIRILSFSTTMPRSSQIEVYGSVMTFQYEGMESNPERLTELVGLLLKLAERIERIAEPFEQSQEEQDAALAATMLTNPPAVDPVNWLDNLNSVGGQTKKV